MVQIVTVYLDFTILTLVYYTPEHREGFRAFIFAHSHYLLNE